MTLKLSLTVAGDGGRVVGRDLQPVVVQDVGAVEEPEVGAAVEHVEVHAAAVREDVVHDLLELWKEVKRSRNLMER